MEVYRIRTHRQIHGTKESQSHLATTYHSLSLVALFRLLQPARAFVGLLVDSELRTSHSLFSMKHCTDELNLDMTLIVEDRTNLSNIPSTLITPSSCRLIAWKGNASPAPARKLR